MAGIPNINPNKKINSAFRYIGTGRVKNVLTEASEILESIPNSPVDCVTVATLTIVDEMRIIEVLQADELVLNTVMLYNLSEKDISISIASINPIIAPAMDVNFILSLNQRVELSYILIEGYLYVLSSKIF